MVNYLALYAAARCNTEPLSASCAFGTNAHLALVHRTAEGVQPLCSALCITELHLVTA